MYSIFMLPEFIPSNIAVVANPIKRGLITENTVDMIPQMTVKLNFNLYPVRSENMFLMDCFASAGFSGGCLLGFLAISFASCCLFNVACIYDEIGGFLIIIQ